MSSPYQKKRRHYSSLLWLFLMKQLSHCRNPVLKSMDCTWHYHVNRISALCTFCSIFMRPWAYMSQISYSHPGMALYSFYYFCIQDCIPTILAYRSSIIIYFMVLLIPDEHVNKMLLIQESQKASTCLNIIMPIKLFLLSLNSPFFSFASDSL